MFHFVGSPCEELEKANSFFASFVCGHLAKHDEAQQLVTLIEDHDCLVIRFHDIDAIYSIYCDFKQKNDGMLTRLSNRIFERKSIETKDKIKKLKAQLKKTWLLEVDGINYYDNNYLEYEVENPKMRDLLIKSYNSVQENPRKVIICAFS